MIQALNGILQHLNANSGAYTVVFTFFVTAATLMYAILTRTLVAETKRMRERQTEPDLSIAAVPSREWLNWINIEISNSGAGAALDIRLRVEPDFENRPGTWLSELGPFKNGIKHLASGSKITFFVSEMVGKDSEKRRASEFTIFADYQNEDRRVIHRELPISLSYMDGLMAIDKDPLIGLRAHAEVISRAVAALADALKGDIDRRQWAAESYYFKSAIGMFWIRPQAGMRHHYRLSFNHKRLGVYQGVWGAIDDVREHRTGLARWDDRKELDAPADITEWEMGTPDMLI